MNYRILSYTHIQVLLQHTESIQEVMHIVIIDSMFLKNTRAVPFLSKPHSLAVFTHCFFILKLDKNSATKHAFLFCLSAQIQYLFHSEMEWHVGKQQICQSTQC